MRYIIIMCLTISACDSWNRYASGSDADPARCTLPSDASIATVTIDLPLSGAPIATDLIVRGSLAPRPDVNITKVLVSGIPANHDGPDFLTFDATVPLNTLQALAVAAGTPTRAKVDVEAITDCAPGPLLAGSFDVTLRAATSLTLAVTLPAHGYIPNSIGVPATFALTANPEAAGLPLVVTATQGTVAAPAVLPGDGIQPVMTTVFLTPDPNKQGTAKVVVQAATMASVDSVTIVGPPSINPGSALIQRGGPELQVFLNNTLPGSQVAGSIAGCIAGVTPGIAVHVGPNDISGQGLTPLVAMDSAMHPSFRVAVLPTAVAASFVSVTCFDVYGQSVTGTYTAQ